LNSPEGGSDTSSKEIMLDQLVQGMQKFGLIEGTAFIQMKLP